MMQILDHVQNLKTKLKVDDLMPKIISAKKVGCKIPYFQVFRLFEKVVMFLRECFLEAGQLVKLHLNVLLFLQMAACQTCPPKL